MSIPSLTLYVMRQHEIGEVVLTPTRRMRVGIVFTKVNMIAELRDREKSGKLVLEVVGAELPVILAQLAVRSLAQGIFYPPARCDRVGIRHNDKGQFGCFGLDEQGREKTPLLIVDYRIGMAVAQPNERMFRFRNELNPNEAMIRAAEAFFGNARAA